MQETDKILETLENSGYEAYMVGGCVRDRLMGRHIHDIDIATNALPEETVRVFSGYKVIPTGVKHGTVTVYCGDIPFEITTYRIDGCYTDSRRPDTVEFTSDIRTDLSRRDFTVNSIAMDRRGDIIDPFGGEDDIKRGIIRCVGDPEKRFTEDALRMLRALRFASQLSFDIECRTSEAMMNMRSRLSLISSERIRVEFDKLVCGRNSTDILLRYRDMIAEFIPEIVPCFDFEQHSRYHKYDVYSHIVHTVEAVPEEDVFLRRAMFFHDIGKPQMFTLDENGEGHFKGHAGVSAEMTRSIMKRLAYDRRTIEHTCRLIGLHSEKIGDETKLKRLLGELGCEDFKKLMEFRKADNCGKNEFVLAENLFFDALAEKAQRFTDEGCCVALSQLAVSGNDIEVLGASGKMIGEVLEKLLDAVISGSIPNERDALTSYAERELL